MRIVLLSVIATLCVGCGSLSGSIFGGYSGELSSNTASMVNPGATFAVVNASGEGVDREIEESVSRGLTDMGFVAVSNPAQADIIAEYQLTVSEPKVRFRNVSSGFNSSNEMYTQKTYAKTFTLSLHKADSQLIWEGELKSEDSSKNADKLTDIYVGQLLSQYGQDVSNENWFVPRFGSDNIVAKSEK
jgi:hypothetical protein